MLRATVGLLLGCVLFAPARPARAQRVPALFYGAAAGLSYQSDSDDGHLAPLGPLGYGFLGWRVSERFAARTELHLAGFAGAVRHVHGPCVEPFGCHPPVGPVLLSAATASALVDAAPAEDQGVRYLLGGGLYHALQHPGERRPRPGWNAGLVWRLSRARPGAAVEFRYHRVPRWGTEDLWLLPVTFTLSWAARGPG